MKTLIIAEKPSVARDIAAAIGGCRQAGSWLEGEQFIVSSGIGHLVQLGDPEAGPMVAGFDGLPRIPERFSLSPIPGTIDQLKLLGKLIARPDVARVVNACDAGREGELIFNLIYEFHNGQKPVFRMWIQSMTATAIREAFKGLRPAAAYARLGDAARSRSEADWLVGINGTRAVSALSEALTERRERSSVGRVQTPTLAIVVHQELAIRAFVARPYWEVHGTFAVQGGEYVARWRGASVEGADGADISHRIWDKSKADALLTRCRGAVPTSVRDEFKEVSSAPPKLFDLTTLQREANRRFKFSAKKTLDLTQALYEKHKVLTYPRTDSNALPEDYLGKAQAVVQALGASAYAEHANRIVDNSWVRPDKRIFNNAKISDHFAIIPTGKIPEGLSDGEAKVFDLVVRRFLAAFHPSAVFAKTERTTVVAGDSFIASGRVLQEAGWMAVYGKKHDSEDDGTSLCPLVVGEKASNAGMKLVAQKTKPPTRFNEATLLGAMETAGKLLEDEEMRDAMRDRGLGTPATRASILEALLADQDRAKRLIEPYLRREGKEQHLVPTEKGIQLVQFLEANGLEELTSPRMTGDWECKLRLMERAEYDRSNFMAESALFARRLVDTLKARAAAVPPAPKKALAAPCPQCGAGLEASARQVQCSKDCGYRQPRSIAGRELSDAELTALYIDGNTGLLEGFVSKAKRLFNAKLKLTAERRLEFEFEPRAEPVTGAGVTAGGTQKIYPCPLCRKPLRLRQGAKGAFWGCAAYPECKHTQPDDDGKPGVRTSAVAASMPPGEVAQASARRTVPAGAVGSGCPTCGSGRLVSRASATSDKRFLGCSKFPQCRHFEWEKGNGKP
ncbi:DNA topoisomerase [Achromobacter marplatensis]|uniref:DNA topoisomerase n=1 Tax=Achromobacter marplatensis TaxID=470868 RepID=A0ABX9GF35_9BURK|nr:DNA topoisomerase [Achromobacter marplatensis]OWT68632.1 DNA topoisomerase [Achromobacter marplatensis]RBP20915.1 DNA topoisomerase-3 [Achromobacter marplatensis]CAB3676671.1 DNA topoisomerase 3 [Achromobacter marplatensis]